MALPGTDYTAANGLTVSDDSDSTTVAQYVIDMSKAAFRHWSSPIEGSNGIRDVARSEEASTEPYYHVEHDDCFTALDFRVSSIIDVPFNTTGSDDLIWAANGEDYFVGYHGSYRGRFQVDWQTGDAFGAASKISDDSEISSGATPLHPTVWDSISLMVKLSLVSYISTSVLGLI